MATLHDVETKPGAMISHRVIVAEPHWLVRQGLVAVVDRIDAYEVVGDVSRGTEAIDAVQRLRPTLLLLSLGITDPGCVEVVLKLRQLREPPRVLALSQRGAEASARDALRAGCDGFIDKERSGEALEQAIRDVMAGRPFLDPLVSLRLLLAPDDLANHRHDVLAVLTQREHAVFVHIAAGHTNRSAGEALHISAKTVEKHRALVMQKLNLRSAFELRMLAVDVGLIERQCADRLARIGVDPVPASGSA